MVTRRASRAPRSIALVATLGALLAASPVRADSPRLAEARRAVESVDYDAARRLLVDALRDGDNSPAAMREIYRLSARAAVVLGERDLAEQYYRRWLAIDPDASLPADTAPKLREPFIAAEAYIAAHGRLRARALRAAGGSIDVELVADPLGMARAAAALSSPRGAPARFDADHRAHLPASPRVAIVDDAGNRLLELEPEAAAAPLPGVAPPPPPPSDSPPWTQSWLTWAVPTALFTLGAGGFGIAALASYNRAQQLTAKSGESFLADAQANEHRGAIFAWITVGSAAAAIACAVPTTIYFRRERAAARLRVTPTATPSHVGLAVSGEF